MRATRQNAIRPVRLLVAALVSSQSGVVAKIQPQDIKAVSCAVCELAVEKAIGAGLDEDNVEDLCEPKNKLGRWLAQLDLVDESDGRITVQDMGTAGQCRKECSTASRACRNWALEDTDALLAMLRKGSSAGRIKGKLCKKSCKQYRNLVANRPQDEEFKEVDAKIAEMEDMMKDMKEKTGMGMKMYSREDFASMSDGDMEAMAAREQLAQERMESRYMNGDMPEVPPSPDL
ncbi:unnamed protein product [Amoebophrya sp. A25]|nr:unnamed protein product [Amoebophrya sp. A25]|eukprot:GSA25T00002172001.1